MLLAKTMNSLWTILIGLAVGIMTKRLVQGRDGGGGLLTILLGIAGAVLASFLGRAAGWYEDGRGTGIVATIVGAVIPPLIYRVFRRGSYVPITFP